MLIIVENIEKLSKEKEAIKRSVKKYELNNKEKVKIWHKKWMNSEKGKIWRKEYDKKYRIIHKFIRREYQYNLLDKSRKLVFNTLGNKCKRCGFSDPRALQIDHINGGGTKEFRRIKNNRVKYFRQILTNRDNYQILCANCNWIKRVENKECTQKDADRKIL